MDDRNWDSPVAGHSESSAGRPTSNYPTPLSPAPPVSQSSRKQRASHNIQSSSAQQSAQPASAVIDVYAHPAAVAYAAAHPRRSIPKFGPYLLLQTLGEGEFGKVKLGLHGQWGEEVAVKLIRRENVDSTLRMSKVEREIEVLRNINHPNIVRLYDVIETDKYIGIILEYASGGELFDHILAHRYLREKDASKLFAQLISGVYYIHAKKIVHRDLKLENLLLDRNRNVIITDFGFANRFEHKADDLMQTSCGSPCYAAPELVISEGLYVGSAVDIWSCGVILYAMLAGYLPFDDDPANPDGDNINLLYKYIINTPLTFPDYVSTEARDLLGKMLVPNPTKRADLRVIMAHSWLSNYRHLFERSVEEVERIASENQMAKRMAYQRQVKANKDRDTVDPKMARSHSARPDPSRGGKDYVYETAEPVPSQPSGRRVAASAIVMPSSTPMHDDPFSSIPAAVEEQQLAAPDAGQRSRKESSRSKKSSRSTKKESSSKAASPTPASDTNTPKDKKKSGYRHTIQLEYDDGESQQTPSRSSRSHHHRNHAQDAPPTNGHADVEGEDQNVTPRKIARPSEPPPPLPTPPHNVTLTLKHSPASAPSAPLDVLPSSPTTPTANASKAPSPPHSPSSQRSRTASSPTYMRASATEPSVPTMSSRREEMLPSLPSPPIPVSGSEETPSLTFSSSDMSATTPASSTVMTSDASHHSTGSSNKSTRHRKGMSMDKFGLGKLLSGGSKDSALHGKDSSTGSGHPHISGPYNIRKASEGEKMRVASEGGSTDHSASNSPGVRSKSSTLGANEGEKLASTIEGVPEGSLKSKRKSGRKTLSLMVEPFGRSLKDRSKARSVTAESGKSIDPSQPPSTAPLPPATSSKPPQAASASAHVKSSSSHQGPPPTPSSNWRIPLFRESRVPPTPSRIEDPIAVVGTPTGGDVPTMASRGSTTKSQKVMDWFRMKSLAKRNSQTSSPTQPFHLSDEPTTPTLDTYHVVNDQGSTSTVHQSNSSQAPAVVVSNTEWSPAREGSAAESTSSRASRQPSPIASAPAPTASFNIKAIRVHHGAVDQATVTTGAPPEVFEHVTKVLIGMGVDIQKESEFKYRCIRPKKKKDASNGHREAGTSAGGLAAFTMMGSAASNGVDKRGLPLPSHGSFSSGGILKGMFMRRQSSQVHSSAQSTALPSPSISLDSGDSTPGEGGAFSPPDSSLGHPEGPHAVTGPIYGDRTADQADEVRFSVELTRIDRLDGTFSLDIRRLKGNLRSYKFLYDTLRERCDFH